MADPTTDTTPITATETWKPWLARITAARRLRDDRVSQWQENVDRRVGAGGRTIEHASFLSVRSREGILVNQDWPLTKAKIAQLYSQTPEIRLTPKFPEFQQAVPAFSRELNTTITDANVGATIEEVLADVVNASGIGGAIVFCEKRTERKAVPAIDPATLPPDQQAVVLSGQIEIPTTEVDHVADIQYLVERISPADLLIPADFTGSDYDKARWLGREGRMTWAQAVNEFGLAEEQKDRVCGTDKRSTDAATHSLNTDASKFHDTDVVNYQELFYWRHFYHADEPSFKALHRLAFVDGLEVPVTDEPYSAQRRDEQTGMMLGVVRNPIRICTLTYVSDDALPPSDSTIGQFQVAELESSRDAMVEQRKHSIPIRWFDSNRVSPGTRALLEKGTFQGFIPTNGPGDRAVGEVSRASFPQERFEFDHIIKNDLTEIWQVGTNQAGAFASGERSAREAGIIERNFQRRMGQEQDKVSKFFLGIAEVLAGHLSLYGTSDQPDEVGPARDALSTGVTYSLRIDSTVRLDAEQRIAQLDAFVNKWGQSGFINPKPIVEEWAGLIALDPSKVVIDPQPKPPEPVKISIGSAEDIINPLMLAALSRTGQLPTPEDLSAVVQLLTKIGTLPELAALTIPPTPTTESGPPGEVATPGISNADWQEQPRINKRDQDGGA